MKELLLDMFTKFELSVNLMCLLITGIGDDPLLRPILVSFEQLSLKRQLAKETQLAKELQLANPPYEPLHLKERISEPPVCLHAYFKSVLEEKLTKALLLMAAAKKELPAALDSSRKEMAFFAEALREE